jgi:electron transfer flavoprotein beta subunit
VNVLVCIKRVPATGGRVTLTPDGRAIDTTLLGFTISPHEECAVEEAVRLVEAGGGAATVLTLGPDAAAEQLRDAMAVGVDAAILLETDGAEWGPAATAAAIASAVAAREAAAGASFDLLLFGNEAADSADHQVGIRVAVALDRPVVTGVKRLEAAGGGVRAWRERDGAWDVYDLSLPAVVTVREGINLPRYPSVPGRLRARKKEIQRVAVSASRGPQRDAELIGLRLPATAEHSVEVLGHGPDAVPRIVAVLEQIGLVAR